MATDRLEKAVAIDIGGTKTLIGIVNARGEILHQKKMQTNIGLSLEDHLSNCLKEAEACLAETGTAASDIAGIGLSLPGIADPSRGTLIHAPYAGWRHVPVRNAVQALWPGVRVSIENDVNACAMAECKFGNASDYGSILWVTISTGIGGALVVNRQVLSGEQWMSGEIGHIKVEWDRGRLCGCGNTGCVEAHASGAAISNKAEVLLSGEWKRSELREYLAQHQLPVDTASLAKAAFAGNKQALQLFAEAGSCLGRAFSYAINLFNPGAIIVGGGVSQSFALMEPSVRATIQQAVIGESNKQIPLIPTALGYEASLLGAASLVWPSAERNE